MTASVRTLIDLCERPATNMDIERGGYLLTRQLLMAAAAGTAWRREALYRLLDAGAHLDAAYLFLPEGYSCSTYSHPAVPGTESKPRSHVTVYQLEPNNNTLDRRTLDGPYEATAPYLPRAVLAACLRTRGRHVMSPIATRLAVSVVSPGLFEQHAYAVSEPDRCASGAGTGTGWCTEAGIYQLPAVFGPYVMQWRWCDKHSRGVRDRKLVDDAARVAWVKTLRDAGWPDILTDELAGG